MVGVAAEPIGKDAEHAESGLDVEGRWGEGVEGDEAQFDLERLHRPTDGVVETAFNLVGKFVHQFDPLRLQHPKHLLPTTILRKRVKVPGLLLKAIPFIPTGPQMWEDRMVQQLHSNLNPKLIRFGLDVVEVYREEGSEQVLTANGCHLGLFVTEGDEGLHHLEDVLAGVLVEELAGLLLVVGEDEEAFVD